MEPAQTTNIVDVYVNYLRRKLQDPAPGLLIKTVRGQGYMVPGEGELMLDRGGVVRTPETETRSDPAEFAAQQRNIQSEERRNDQLSHSTNS